MSALLYELRVGVRRLVRDPARSGISVVAFTLGIGLTAGIFSVAYNLLFRGTPYDGPDQLVAVERRNPETGARLRFVPYLDFLDIAEAQTSMSVITATGPAGFDLADNEAFPARVSGARVSPSFLGLLRVSPELGRGFTPDEVGPAARVALLSDRLWRTRYGADPGMVGGTIRLNGETYTVVGIMAAGFHFPTDEDIWVPFDVDPTELTRTQYTIQVMGRIAESTEPAAAVAELDAISARLQREYGDGGLPPRMVLVPYVRSNLGEDEVGLLWALVLGSFLILGIACLNVTNLLTSVAADRTPEVALHTALGASRGRVVAQMLLDALLLSLVGASLGVVVAYGFVGWLNRALIGQIPPWLAFRVDAPILAFAIGVALLAALIAGLTPALRSVGVSVREVLQDESRGSSSRRLGRLSHAMVVMTMALAYPLLVGAGLLIASFGAWTRDLPFDGDRVVVAQLSLPARNFPEPQDRIDFIDDFIRWAEGQAGIGAAAWGDVVPALGIGSDPIELEGEQYMRDQDYPRVRLGVVRPGYFETMGVGTVRGRAFDSRDRTGPPVAIVNEPFAARHFARSDPIGRRLRVAGVDDPYRTIVGVVPDLRMNGLEQAMPEGIYVPTPPLDPTFGYFLVRSSADPVATIPAIRDGIAALEPELPVRALEPLDDWVRNSFWVITVVGPIFTVFGFAALFLASVGLFGVVAHSVSRRTREIGVRMALGATARSVLLMIARSGLGQAALGAVLGSGFAYVGSRLLAGALFGVEPGDPTTMMVVGLVLLGSALLATIVPAVRAMRLSPVDALQGR